MEGATIAGWEGIDTVQVVPGPDEYLFGEEKAMLEVVEGKLPLPRVLPPYMQGLFATMASPNPTAVNNVETLSHVTRILARSADEFRAVGTQEAPGTRFLAIESCGQCLACKLGTTEICDRLDRLVRGEGTQADIAEVGLVLRAS